MQSEAELKLKLFRLLDTQHEEGLKEIHDWLSAKIGNNDKLSQLEEAYKEMAADKDREKEATEWIEGTLNSSEL